MAGLTPEDEQFLEQAKASGVTNAGQLAILLKQDQMKRRTQAPLPDAKIPDLEKIGTKPKQEQPETEQK